MEIHPNHIKAKKKMTIHNGKKKMTIHKRKKKDDISAARFRGTVVMGIARYAGDPGSISPGRVT